MLAAWALADLGSAFLLSGLALVVLSGALAVSAGRRGDVVLARIARRAFYTAALAAVGASATLLAALLGHDFSLAFVTEHTDRGMSPALTAAAFYGGQEGSLLYWLLLLSLAGSVSLAAAARTSVRLAAYANAVLAAVAGFFGLVLVFVASPFAVLPSAPSDGFGLNPVLRDGGMLIHPPFLLAGYSAFAVPFAFAMAALIAGRDDAAWISQTRRFALLAWGLQSVGLTLGMWWAYHVLGWGGYWGWDPVENAALMPWLVTTAYLHSAQVQERRGTLRAWNFGLVIAAFLLSILGTFIVRSGVLPSVHSFAVGPLGPWFLGFFAIAVAASGVALAWRAGLLSSPQPVEATVSREGAFLLQNLLLAALTGAILWGTLLPLLSGMLGRELVVGPAYYERVTAPLLLAVLALLAAGPLLPWRRAGAGWERALRWPAAAAAATLAVMLVVGVRQVPALVALPLVSAGVVTCLAEYGRWALAARRWTDAGRALAANRRRYGAYMAHLGILVVAAGLIGSHVWQQQRQVTVRPGDQVVVGRYAMTYEGTVQRPAGDHTELLARLRLGDETLEPGRSTFASQGGQSVTRVAIRSTALDDLYLVLVATEGDTPSGPGGQPPPASGGGKATLQVFVNPLVAWVWAGAALLVLGVLVGNLQAAGAAAAEASPAPRRATVGAR